MKVLITGANGMLGKDIAEAFSDYELFLTDRDDLNITNKEKVGELIKKIKPWLVINCAGYIDVERAEDEKSLVNQINGEGVLNLATSCKNNSCILAHISTEYVFNGEDKYGYDENSNTNPETAYGRSKAIGEKFLKNSACDFYLVRTSWLYGKNPQRGKGRGVNFVDRIQELAKEQDELDMVNDQISKPTYTKDFAKALYELVTEKYAFGIYHLVNEEETTPYEFANEIFKIKNINIKTNPISYTTYSSKVKRPINAILINTKFPKLRSWKEAIKDYLS